MLPFGCTTGDFGGGCGLAVLGGLGGAGLFPTLGLITKLGLVGRVGCPLLTGFDVVFKSFGLGLLPGLGGSGRGPLGDGLSPGKVGFRVAGGGGGAGLLLLLGFGLGGISLVETSDSDDKSR